jgi:ATP-dependent Clp protease ATP-binding subunit ClpA
MYPESGIVYKYFDLIDGFIRVRLLGDGESLPGLSSSNERPPDRREYRALVVHHCVVELEDNVLPVVRRIYPDDEAAAQDLLYQICIDVNPKLEIHSVSLPAGENGTENIESQEGAERLAKSAPGLEKSLLKEVVGQDSAVRNICRSIRKAACGLKDPDRPIGTFLLVGRTGTGKTELSKALSRHLHGRSPVRIDCSEFALPHETAKLIGAPPGYVGHNEGGTLTEALMRDPWSVVLFDEIEKGHEKLHHMLLQILDEGRLTDSKGNTADFRNAVVLLTSNVGTADYAKAANKMGFGQDGSLSTSDFDEITRNALTRDFRPELLNRLDGILTFQSLDKKSRARITSMRLKGIAGRMEKVKIAIKWTPSLAKQLAEAGCSEEYGARELRRTVDRMVEQPLADGILDGVFKAGSKLTIRWKEGNVVFDQEAA